MRRFVLMIASALMLCIGAAAIPSKPYPERLVNDFAEVFSSSQRDSLEAALVQFDDSTSNQICVVTVPDLEGRDVAEYALRLGNEWGVGSSRNNGIIVLLMPRGAEGYVDVTIQVGRGLEGAVTDAYSSRIIRNIMGPKLRQDEYWRAIADACNELMALAAGEISEPRDGASEEEDDLVQVIISLIIVIALLILILKVSRNGGNGGSSHTRGGGGGPIIFGGGHFGGGSGFGGGGGFGGFGGGSFGGGGASGRF